MTTKRVATNLLTNRFQICVAFSEVIFEAGKEVGKARSQLIQRRISVVHRAIRIDKYIGYLLPLLNHDGILLVVLVVSSSMFWKVVIKRLEDDAIFVLYVFFIDDAESAKVRSEQA